MQNKVWVDIDPLGQQEWENNYRRHRKKMIEIASCQRKALEDNEIKEKETIQFKRQICGLQSENKKQNEINKQNLKLMERLLDIQDRKLQEKKQKAIYKSTEVDKSAICSFILKRQKQAKQIYNENHVLAQRILNQKSFINSQEILKHEDNYNKIKQNISRVKRKANQILPPLQLKSISKDNTLDQENSIQRKSKNSNRNSSKDNNFKREGKQTTLQEQFYNQNLSFQDCYNENYVFQNKKVRHSSLIASRPQSIIVQNQEEDCDNKLQVIRERIQSLRQSPQKEMMNNSLSLDDRCNKSTSQIRKEDKQNLHSPNKTFSQFEFQKQ